MLMKKKNLLISTLFLLSEVILYGVILTSSGNLLIWSEFTAIVLCFLFALLRFTDPLVILGLSMTVCADFCLVVCDPIEQLWGMIFFLTAQTFYGVKLHSQGLHRGFLIARLALSLSVEAMTVLILGENTDALALVSMLYYTNLVMNMVCSFARFWENRLLAIGFVLFILCDTVIGLQVASGGYLPIPEGTFIHKLIFSSFHLSWFFYLPSQVLIALSARKK